MTLLSSFHIIMVILVYVVQRKHSRTLTNGIVQCHDHHPTRYQDSIREVFSSFGFVTKPHPAWVYLATLIPLYVIATSPQITNTHWEKLGLMGLMIAIVRSVQVVLNKDQRFQMEYTTSLVTITLLMAVYHNVIPNTQRHLIYPYIVAHGLLVLLAYPKRTITSTIIDDVALSHLMFYLFK
jgi:hypothetical protein